MARILGEEDGCCPNCLEGPESNVHLNKCLDKGCTLLFESDVKDLQIWMAKNDSTDAELQYWITYYLLFGGEKPMSSLGNMSPAMLEVAEAVDCIGFVDIMHGCLPFALQRYQSTYYTIVNS